MMYVNIMTCDLTDIKNYKHGLLPARQKCLFFYFLAMQAMQHGMQALRSWTRARTHAHYRGADCGSDHELLIAR